MSNILKKIWVVQKQNLFGFVETIAGFTMFISKYEVG